MELGVTARARGYRLFALDEIDSTNDEARRLITEGERGPLWIVAKRQSKGRGRLGREWISAAGNLYASLVLADFADPRVAPQLGFVIGVAAVRALGACAPSASVTLKWPNDLLLDGAKLGGVLLENVNVPTGDARAPSAPVAIIGIGVNCATAPGNLPYPAATLGALGVDAPTAAHLFAQISDAFIETFDVWRGGAGFAQLRDEWLRHSSGVGEAISVALANETLHGRFDTIDATGRLVITTSDGARVIDAGDVVIGPRRRVARARTGTHV